MNNAPLSTQTRIGVGRMDRAGILLSGLCAVHCVTGLVLIGLLGIGGGVLLDPAIHRIGLSLAVGIGALSLGIGVLRHRRPAPLVIGVIGLALMAFALTAPHGASEAVLTIAGVTLVAFAHVMNLRQPHRPLSRGA